VDAPGVMKMRLLALRTIVIALAVMLVVGAAYAQRGRWSYREGTMAPIFAPAMMPDANFIPCRLMYRSVRAEAMGIGWETDYPYAEINLTIRLSELTKTPVSLDERRVPHHYVVRMTDDALFNCPFTIASDVGTIGLSPVEAERLRAYLLKGGFLWVDDFWGTAAWEQWSREIAKVLPPSEYPITDMKLDDPMLRALFEVRKIPQITNIQFWRAVGGSTTSERGADSAEVHFRAIRDRQGAVVVLMSHNTDIGDSWEREAEDPGFFYQFSPAGYAVGINVLLHAMSH
jgi:hypothetical protein